MTAERWGRLAADLLAALDVLAVRVEHQPYPGGVSHSISVRTHNGELVEIHDKWWSKNDTVWIGWQVHTEGRDSIVTRTWPLTKKRSEVVAAVREAAMPRQAVAS